MIPEIRLRERSDPEHGVRECQRERDDSERDVESEADEAGDDQEQENEAEDSDAASQTVPPDLLLQRHGSGANETCGASVSPAAEKNSFSRKPRGLATSTQGMLWIAVLKCITVEL